MAYYIIKEHKGDKYYFYGTGRQKVIWTKKMERGYAFATKTDIMMILKQCATSTTDAKIEKVPYEVRS